MDPEKVAMDRFNEEWTRAIDQALPPLDLDRAARAVIRAKRERDARGSRGLTAKWRWLAAAAVLATVIAGVLVSRSEPSRVFTLNDQPLAEGAHVATGHGEQVIRFSEGSTIAVGPESSLEVPEASAEKVAVVVAHGSAHFDVVKRPDATWKVTAGPFEVLVLGTAFRVVWLPEVQHFAVSVLRGTVTVNGPMLGGARAVHTGSRCVVDLTGKRFAIEPNSSQESAEGSTRQAESTAPAPSSERDTSDLIAPTTPGSAIPERPRAGGNHPVEAGTVRRPETWRELERQGQFEEAVKLAEHSGLDAIYDLASVEDLMSLARAARLVGRQDVSAGALLSCRRRFPSSRDAAMAAYLLGRNAPPAEAVRWFSAYLAEAPQGSWAREAAGRLIEAQAASGNKVAAREAAQKYLASYPSGPHAEFAKQVLVE